MRALHDALPIFAKALVADKLRLTNARLEAVLADGLLELKRFTADGYGGALALSGQLDARDAAVGLQVAGDVKAERIELKGLLQDIADSDRFSGPLTLYSDFATRGDSEAALVSNLSGHGTLTGPVPVATTVADQAEIGSASQREKVGQ